MSFKALQTVSIKYVDDLHAKNQETNSTDMFDSPNHIVLRRGNAFELLVEVSSLSDLKKESVTVEFHRGARARYTRGTMFQGACDIKSKFHYQWDMKVSLLSIHAVVNPCCCQSMLLSIHAVVNPCCCQYMLLSILVVIVLFHCHVSISVL